MCHVQSLGMRAATGLDESRIQLIADENLVLVAATSAADRFLSRSLELSARRGRLVATSQSVQNKLEKLCRAAARAMDVGSAGGVLGIPCSADGDFLILRVQPLPRHRLATIAGRPLIHLEVVMPARHKAPRTRDWDVFGLTAAETRLAARLLETDGTLRDVADELGISYATARVHLARIFEKTGVRTQAQLTRLLLRTQL